MMNKLIAYVLIEILVCCHLGFAAKEKSSSRLKKEQTPSIDRYNFFDAELFEVLSREENKNILISPLSIKMTLGMLLEGAEGKTAEEIRTALRLPKDNDLARKEFHKWMTSLKSKKSSSILQVVNRLFISDKFSIDPEYRQSLIKNYLGDVKEVKFDEPKETSQIINNWISNKTAGLIPSLVSEEQINGNTKMMLTNAVYFKGKWLNPFPPERTAIKCFYPAQGDCKKTYMMMDSGTYDYAYISKLDAQAIELPYDDGKFSMLVILPNKKDGIMQLSRDLIHVNVEAILSEMKQQEVYIQIPRFTIDYEAELVQPLQTLQISEMFSESANLKRLLAKKESIAVGNVLHSAKIIVNEEGSEAAAATGALFVPLMGGTRAVFTAEHPFLFFIRDVEVGSILFAGRVSQTEEVTTDNLSAINNLQPEPLDKNEESVPQVFYQEIFTPSPPISNAVPKDQPYVNRKPGKLPPPPPPAPGLPNGFLEQPVVGSSTNLESSDKSSSQFVIYGSKEVQTIEATKKVVTTTMTSTNKKTYPTTTKKPLPVTSAKPLFTVPPSVIRPTGDTLRTVSSTVKRNIDRSPSSNQVPSFVYFAPIRRRIIAPGSFAYQENIYESLLKKLTYYNQYATSDGDRKNARAAESRKFSGGVTGRQKEEYEPSDDKISFQYEKE